MKLSPNNPDALSNLGFLAYERGNNEKAETLLRQAIKADKDIFYGTL
ncbi:MAG: tetratricopeptide repeat protein [Blastocatellia bacterium]|nr:tetratricopeptide repeat protein [Blastocatellia bacterium]